MTLEIDLLRARVKVETLYDPAVAVQANTSPTLEVDHYAIDGRRIITMNYDDGDTFVEFRLSKDSAIALAHYLMTAAEWNSGKRAEK